MQEPAEWKLKAACKGQPTALFFDPEYLAVAQAFCAVCPVQRRCWQAGYRHGEYGVWGGVMRAFPADEAAT